MGSLFCDISEKDSLMKTLHVVLETQQSVGGWLFCIGRVKSFGRQWLWRLLPWIESSCGDLGRCDAPWQTLAARFFFCCTTQWEPTLGASLHRGRQEESQATLFWEDMLHIRLKDLFPLCFHFFLNLLVKHLQVDANVKKTSLSEHIVRYCSQLTLFSPMPPMMYCPR